MDRRRIKYSFFTLIISIICSGFINAQSAHNFLQDGDKKYDLNDYLAAEEYYRKAKEKENSLQSNFNLGNSTYQQGRFEESIEAYQNAIPKAKNEIQKSDAYYNLGNAYFESQELEKAIESYKQSIKLNSKNEAAKYNLGLSRQLLKQMRAQQQQQNQDQNQDNQENQENQKQQDQQQQNQENQENQEQQDQQQQNQEQKDSTQQFEQSAFDSTRLEKQELDSIDAQKLLKIIQEEEQKVQEKLRKFNSKRKKPDKDW